MEYTHTQKNVATSPRKLRLVADMIRTMNPVEALDVLHFTQKAAALPLTKAIKTVLANAKEGELSFKSIEINDGPKIKRFRFGTAGRHTGRPYKKRWSHIKIILTDDLNKKEVKVEKAEKTKEVK